MLGLRIVLGLVGLGALCSLLFCLASYALPLYVALAVGLFLESHGAGFFLAILAAAAIGSLVLAFGRLVMRARNPVLRLMITALFALPAAVAGYSVARGLTALGTASTLWRDVFDVLGAVMTGAGAFARLTASAGNW